MLLHVRVLATEIIAVVVGVVAGCDSGDGSLLLLLLLLLLLPAPMWLYLSFYHLNFGIAVVHYLFVCALRYF